MTEQNETKIAIQDYFKGFPESPASDTIRWVDGAGFDHMTTIRAWSGTILYSEMAKFIGTVIETGGKPVNTPHAPAPTAAPKPASTPAPIPQANASGTSIMVKKIKVTQDVKDGATRTIVDLFRDGDKFPELKAFFKSPDLAKIAFGIVTGLDFSTTGEYNLDCIADYRLSDKLNTKGNPYKNLVAIRPIE